MRRALLLAATFALVGTGTAVAQEEGFLKVTGGGQVTAMNQESGPGDTIAFNAQQTSAEANDDGSFPAKGQLQVIDRVNGVKFHGVVTCIRALEGEDEGVVRFGGFERTRANGTGGPFTVDATDNGEGSSADSDDMIAFRRRSGADPCEMSDFDTELRSTRLARGNVQLHK